MACKLGKEGGGGIWPFRPNFRAQGDRSNPDTKNAANLAAFFMSGVEGDVPTMFGARGNTRHVKCARLDVFYMSGGKRRLPNTKAMPILMAFVFGRGGVHAVKI